jgi:hypothetical protein
VAKRKKLSPSSHELGVDLDDQLALGKITPDRHFLLTRVAGIRDPDDAYREAMITLLRSDIPLSRTTRDLLSNELVTAWWPKGSPQKQRRRDREQQARAAERGLVDYIAKTKHKDASNPLTLAQQDADKEFGLKEGTLQRRRSRYRKHAKE